jgi:hypothetical protein
MSMKSKILLLIAAITFSVTLTNAQIATEGSKFVNLGLGLGTNLYSGLHYKMQVPPVSASFEYVIKDELFDENSSLGVGGYLGFTSYKWTSGDWGWKYNSIVIGPRGYLHYQFIDNLDTYTGILLGYNILSSKWTGSGTSWGSANSGGIAYSWFVGGRYFFSDNIAAMLELGYGVSYLNIGVSIML